MCCWCWCHWLVMRGCSGRGRYLGAPAGAAEPDFSRDRPPAQLPVGSGAGGADRPGAQCHCGAGAHSPAHASLALAAGTGQRWGWCFDQQVALVAWRVYLAERTFHREALDQLILARQHDMTTKRLSKTILDQPAGLPEDDVPCGGAEPLDASPRHSPRADGVEFVDVFGAIHAMRFAPCVGTTSACGAPANSTGTWEAGSGSSTTTRPLKMEIRSTKPGRAS